MIHNLLAEKLAEYQPHNVLDQENAIKEILQAYTLAGLSHHAFFHKAAFHGGTFLRLVHKAQRFSEDLNFVLHLPDPSFAIEDALEPVVEYLRDEGLPIELKLSSAGSPVRKAFLVTGERLRNWEPWLHHARDPRRRLRIKVEIDTNPPAGAEVETQYLDFPVLSALTTQTLPSAFASKAHALLCRSYTKGRDWYDFIWYVQKGIKPNLELLKNALFQQGPWEGRTLRVDGEWLTSQLDKSIRSLDWPQIVADVQRFLPARQAESLKLWDAGLFSTFLERLRSTF